jgi:hypothetical protein
VLTGIVGVLGLTAFSFAILGNRRTASALRDLVHERTSALIAAKQQAEQTASEKAALLATR